MSLLNAIDRDHVLTALETWDRAGGHNYLLVRGTASTHVLLHQGREYDAPAIAGIAHGLATGNTLTPEEIPGGGKGATRVLTRLGFMIRDDSPPPEPKPARRRTAGTAATRTPAAPARPERPVRLCQRCFIAVPATGVCDNCD